MANFDTHSLTAFAAALLTLSSIGAIVTVPPTEASVSGQIHPSVPELA